MLEKPQANKKKTVVILKSCLSMAGGLEKQAHRLALQFHHAGYAVTILTTEWKSSDIFPYQIVNVMQSGKITFFNLFRFRQKCEEWLQQNPCAYIFGLDRNTTQTHYRAGGGVHRAYLKNRSMTDGFLRRLSFAINPRHKLLLRWEKQLYEDPKLQHLFVNSNMVASEVIKEYNVSPSKISVIHNGVEWNEMMTPFQRWPEEKKQFCKKNNFREEDHHFLFIGKGFRRKGLYFLLQGLACLSAKNWHLSVVGKDRELSYFKHLAKQLNLPVTFFGRASPTPFYQFADTLCIPSTYDPFANVTVEALAMGIPVISSAFNGGKEVLTDETGCIIEELTNPQSVAKALTWALHNPKTLKKSKMIRQTVQYLDFSNQMEKFISITTREEGL